MGDVVPVDERAPDGVRRPFTTTEKNVAWAIGGTLGLFGLFALIGWIERIVMPAIDRAERFVYEPTETVVRLLAVAHTIVATAFLLTSPRARSARGRATLAGLAVLAVPLCLGFLALGGRDSDLAMGLFIVYFLFHELRDEVWFYGVNGDATQAEARRAGRWLVAFVMAVLVASVAWGVASGIPKKVTRAVGMADWTTWARVMAACAVGVAASVGAHLATGRLARGEPRGRAGAFARHRPLVVAVVGVYAVFLVSLALSGRFYAIVGMHVVIWYVFTVRRISKAQRPAVAPAPGTWAWMRTTVAGFNTLHIGLFVGLAAISAVWAFAYKNAPSHWLLGAFTSRHAFPVWTIAHVTLSWLPRK